jgi:hypothetical protein
MAPGGLHLSSVASKTWRFRQELSVSLACARCQRSTLFSDESSQRKVGIQLLFGSSTAAESNSDV